VTATYDAKVSRRTTLQWVASAAVMPGYLLRSMAGAFAPVAKGYGLDPNLMAPEVPWPKTMTSHQLKVTAVLSDLILPAAEGAPSPSALGIPDFVDEWISAPYPEQIADCAVVLEGLTWLENECARRWQRPFLDVEDRYRHELLDQLAQDNGQGSPGEPRSFLRRMRFLVVGAYYGTPEGFKDIGYVGNVPLAAYPPATEQELTIIETELHKLGL
jgi:hypothetical protein